MQILTGLGKEPAALAFSPDGRHLAAGDDRGLHVWDLAAGPEPLWSSPGRSAARNFCFTADGGALVGGGYSSFVRHNVRTGVWIVEPALAELNPHTFSPDGRFALGAAAVWGSGICRLRCAPATPDGWADAWERVLTYDPQLVRSGYRALLFSADGGRLVRIFSRGPDRRNMADTGIEVCATDSGAVVAQWEGALPSYLRQGAVSPSGAVVLIRDRALYAIDTTVPDSKPVKRLNVSTRHFTSAAFSRDGTRLATTSNDTAVTIWDPATWEVRKRYEWGIGRLRTVAFAPDGLRCAAGSDTGQIVVWDLDD